MRRGFRATLTLLALLPMSVFADSSCLYVDTQGVIRQVRGLQQVPSEFRARAVCKDTKPEEIAAPEDVKLGTEARTSTFSTDIGPFTVRWNRSIERCFTRSPSRAVGDAASAVNRALKTGRFAAEIKRARRDWSLVITDKATAFSQIPLSLTLGQHPGFMLPPSQIYIITDFITPDCSGSKIADETLAQVLLHEMGHVIEYLMLGEQEQRVDRQRAEGFAAWFEQYSADFSSVIPRGSVQRYYTGLAREALRRGDTRFSGSAQDYAYSALRFRAIAERRGIATLMTVYSTMREGGLPFQQAVERSTGWNRATLEREMSEIASRG